MAKREEQRSPLGGRRSIGEIPAVSPTADNLKETSVCPRRGVQASSQRREGVSLQSRAVERRWLRPRRAVGGGRLEESGANPTSGASKPVPTSPNVVIDGRPPEPCSCSTTAPVGRRRRYLATRDLTDALALRKVGLLRWEVVERIRPALVVPGGRNRASQGRKHSPPPSTVSPSVWFSPWFPAYCRKNSCQAAVCRETAAQFRDWPEACRPPARIPSLGIKPWFMAL
jgi:hypothetical protein